MCVCTNLRRVFQGTRDLENRTFRCRKYPCEEFVTTISDRAGVLVGINKLRERPLSFITMLFM